MEPFSSGVELAHQITSPLPLLYSTTAGDPAQLYWTRSSGRLTPHEASGTIHTSPDEASGSSPCGTSLQAAPNCCGGRGSPPGARSPPDHPVNSTRPPRATISFTVLRSWGEVGLGAAKITTVCASVRSARSLS